MTYRTYMRLASGSRFDGMNLKRNVLRSLALLTAAGLALTTVGCADSSETFRSPASGPAAENPAAAGGGNVIPSVGGAGNGGGISGGGAGVGSAGQGAR